jgi:mRNA-degrading endonuclease RelE of RelBE toxin-antitoxin system
MKIRQSGIFARTVKKLHPNEKKALDKAVKKIVSDPHIGGMKIGDLSGVRVYKFKVSTQLYLLGYSLDENESVLTLLALGSHENFYRDIKR